ncbi:MMPL family transporter [Pseudoclavibacter sp. CFCC 11306]|uniref:MMPL family transporter n=1 Tax=Pseudoclavibacter sp. CFCC 11306 TaxID=1564493 RepID=UPI00130196D8|nr:MMPL family transporter [Pseudoclavibacter sp. CFCC 11306]KAB1657484.1 MMPL family transporter [Pseudoclavibacter sp. CFCC 11306]
MASLLYRLGRFSAAHRRMVASIWLIIMIAVGGAVAAFAGTTSNNFTIPGTQSQTLIDRLSDRIPAASGGTGSIVFDAGEGKQFTDEQKAAIGRALADVKQQDAVATVIDPFETQQQLESGRQQIDQGKPQLDAAKAQLDAGQQQLDAAKSPLTQLEQARDAAQQAAQQAADAGQSAASAQATAQADALTAQLEAAQQQLAPQQEKLDAGRAELDRQQAELTRAERSLDAASGVQLVSDNGRIAQAQVTFTTSSDNVSAEDKDAVVEAVNQALDGSGVTPQYSTEIASSISGLFGPGEAIGILVAAIVLVIMLGTLIGAGLPLLMAIVGVVVGVGTTFALTGVIEMTSVSPMLALMLGLAVGIDYSLFIVNRHRIQLKQGMPMHESIAHASGTSGNAVLFAGLTVVIALAALAVPGLPFLTVMGLAGAGTIIVAVLVALTLTPAMLGFVGMRILSRRERRALQSSGVDPAAETADAAAEQAPQASSQAAAQSASKRSSKAGPRWGRIVTAHPWLALLVGVIIAGVLALPAGQLRLGLPDGSSEEPSSTAYKSYQLISENFGAGSNGPLVVVAELPESVTTAEQQEDASLDLADRLRSIDGVAAAVPGGASDDHRTAVLQVVSNDGPSTEQTEQLVERIRADAAEIEQQTGAQVGVTGLTAANIDVSKKLGDALPPYLAIVVGLSLVLMILVFRSVLLPVLATLGFLLSLAASLGAVVAIYQWGWLGSVFGVHDPAAVLSFLPIILIGVLFGLAMDYQMFLGSGMRESFAHGATPRQAVLHGYKVGGRVVAAAAIIMISVFAGFVFSELTMIRPIGFALAFGVLIDAFLVRMTIVPAALYLLRRSAWWIPKWLDRILPDVDVEGAKLDALKSSKPTR